MPEEKLNYLSVYVKNITESLSQEEVIKKYAAKKCRKKVLWRYVRQLLIKILLFF